MNQPYEVARPMSTENRDNEDPKNINTVKNTGDSPIRTMQMDLGITDKEVKGNRYNQNTLIKFGLAIIVVLLCIVILVIMSRNKSYDNELISHEKLEPNYNIKLPFSQKYIRNFIRTKEFENGIKFAAVIDPNQKESAASFAMGNAGSYHESLLPGISEGTAHALEHSVYLNIDKKTNDRQDINQWNAFTQGESTQYSFATLQEVFEDSFKVMFNMIADFKALHTIRDEIKNIDSEYSLRKTTETSQLNAIQIMVNPNTKHPMNAKTSGCTETLDHDGIEDEVTKYYDTFYSTRNLNIFLLISLAPEEQQHYEKLKLKDDEKLATENPKSVDSSSTEKLTTTFRENIIQTKSQEYIQKLLIEKTDKMTDYIDNHIKTLKTTDGPKLNMTLPFIDTLPAILFFQNEGKERLEMKYQVRNLVENLFEMASSFDTITFYLKEILIQKFQLELQYAETVFVSSIVEKQFSFLNVEVYYNNLGSKHILELISGAMAGIEEVNNKYTHSHNYYTEVRDISKNQWVLKSYPEEAYGYVEDACTNQINYGFEKMFSGKEVLEGWSGVIQKDIIRQLEFKNLMISIEGPFEMNSQAEKNNIFKEYDLEIQLALDISKEIDFSETANAAAQKSPVLLDQYRAETKKYYHFQKIDLSLQEKLTNIAKTIKFEEYKMTKYKFSEEFMKLIQSRQNLDVKRPSMLLQQEKSLFMFYKFNDNYKVPSVFMEVVFEIDPTNKKTSTSNDSSRALEIQGYCISKVISSIWLNKFYKIRKNMTNLNGINVIYSLGKYIKLELIVPNIVFANTINDTIAILSASFDSITEHEVKNAIKSRYIDLKNTGDMILDKAMTWYTPILMNHTYTNEEQLDFYQQNNKYEDYRYNTPKIQYVFVSGDITQEDAVETTSKITDNFELLSTPWEIPTVSESVYDEKKIILYKKANVNPNDPSEAYTKFFLLGKRNAQKDAILAVMNYFLQDKAFSYLRVELSLGYVTKAYISEFEIDTSLRILIVGNSCHLFEVAVEDFLRINEKTIKDMTQEDLQTYINKQLSIYSKKNTNLNSEASADNKRLWAGDEVGMNTYQQEGYEAIKNQTPKKFYDFYIEFFKKAPQVIFEQVRDVNVEVKINKGNTFNGKPVEVIVRD